MTPWETLIARHATPEMRVCNCKQAYEVLHSKESRTCMVDGQWVEHWSCASGCSAAQITAREHVAARIIRSESEIEGESRG